MKKRKSNERNKSTKRQYLGIIIEKIKEYKWIILIIVLLVYIEYRNKVFYYHLYDHGIVTRGVLTDRRWSTRSDGGYYYFFYVNNDKYWGKVYNDSYDYGKKNIWDSVYIIYDPCDPTKNRSLKFYNENNYYDEKIEVNGMGEVKRIRKK